MHGMRSLCTDSFSVSILECQTMALFLLTEEMQDPIGLSLSLNMRPVLKYLLLHFWLQDW